MTASMMSSTDELVTCDCVHDGPDRVGDAEREGDER